MISLRTPAGPKNIAAISVLAPSGPKGIAAGSIRTPSGDADFWTGGGGALDVSATPNPAYGAAAQPGPTLVTTAQVTAHPSGGVAPYSFAWSKTSGDANWSIVSPTAQTTAFQRFATAPDDYEEAEFEVEVTDSRGRTGTALVAAIATNYGGLGGGGFL